MESIINWFKNAWEFIKRHARKFILALVVIVVAIASVILWPKRESDQMAEISRDDIAQEFSEPSNQPANQPDSGEQPPQAPTPPAPAPQPPTPPQPTSPPRGPATPAQMQFTNYRSDAVGFSANIPQNSAISATSHQVVIATPSGHSVSVSSYLNTRESLSSIEGQLRRSPSVTKLVHTNIYGQPALEFHSPNISGPGYAVIVNNRLYYFTGSLDPQILQDFKFI